MKIRPKNIPMFQEGGVPQWYLDRYGNRTKLLGWDLNQRYNYANENLNLNDHRNAGDLNTVYRKNVAYTGNPGAISSDIQHFYDSDGNGMSAEDFVNFYNKNAAKIRGHWAQDQTYNASTAGDHNRLFRRMFASRSNQQMSPGSDYNIGYQEGLTKGGYDIQDIEGSSTWLRRMDQYENEFDPNNPDSNRLHEIILKDGTKAIVYKKANGDIDLLNNPQNPNVSQSPNNPQNSNTTGKVPVQHKEGYGGINWDKLQAGLRQALPGIIATGRLAGNIWNNNRVYNEYIKGIRPDLRQTYNTYRQVVGDEATKQAYYRRAAQGQTRAARPFTSDADRQMAYQMEAKRVGDEMRAQGDLADNQEIRRTSDESNQHQWANTQRATEVANANIASINAVNELRHKLIAQKHSANWTSVDNYLKGIETNAKKRLAEDQLYADRIWELQSENDLQNDSRLLDLQKKASDLYDKDPNSADTQRALQDLRTYKLNKQIQLLQSRPSRQHDIWTLFAKNGTKFTRTIKADDYLYKSTRDAVEHFRKMSKISSYAQNRKKPKIEKLTSHPKGNTKKYQQGGVAPFTIYTPTVLGGETSMTSQRSTIAGLGSNGSSGTSKKDETLDVIKDLFSKLEGLPSDVNEIYMNMQKFLAKSKAFGNDISSDDLATIYLQQMQQINNVKFSKNSYDKAKEGVISNDAMNEFAIDNIGRVAYQKADGSVGFDSWNNIKENKLTPLTNNDLLNLRAYDTNMAFRDISGILSNGIGITKIADFIKDNLPTLGSSEETIEGYTKKASDDIKEGAKLLAEAPEGDYKFTRYTKQQQQQMQEALKYISSILPRNMKTTLAIHADMQGVTASDMLTSLVQSKGSQETRLEFDAVTGKAAKKEGSGSAGSGSQDIKSNVYDQIQRGQIGVPREFSLITKDSNSKLYSMDSRYISQLPDITEDMSIQKMLSTGLGQILDSRLGITFGDQILSPDNLKDVMFDVGGGFTVVTLPCKYQNGHKVVDFSIKDKYDASIKEVSKKIPINWSDPEFNKALAEKLHEQGLDSLLNGNSLDPKMFGQFMVVSAYTTDKVKFDKTSNYIEQVKNPDEGLENRIKTALSTNKDKNNYSLDIDYWFYGDDAYRGNVFIPLNNDPISAQMGNTTLKMDEAQELAQQYQYWRKRQDMKESSSKVL